VTRRTLLLVLIGVLAISGLALAWRYTALAEFITPEHINAWAKAARETSWAPVALVLAYTVGAFVMVPRQVLTLFATVAFGPILGFTYAMAGVMVCSAVAYYAGHAFSSHVVERLGGDRMGRLKKLLRKHGVISVLTLRVLPTAPFVVESMACGALRIKFWQYEAGTALGMAPGVLATTVFGGEVARALEDASKINYWIAALAVLLFGATMYVLRRILSD